MRIGTAMYSRATFSGTSVKRGRIDVVPTQIRHVEAEESREGVRQSLFGQYTHTERGLRPNVLPRPT